MRYTIYGAAIHVKRSAAIDVKRVRFRVFLNPLCNRVPESLEKIGKRDAALKEIIIDADAAN